ncbi:MAG: hypothetical protein JWQ67_439, partial [Marmoricola sp.]|nr:hypothetical protein [Marmoricola sp.]
RLDPDVDHRSDDYRPNLDGAPGHRAEEPGPDTQSGDRQRGNRPDPGHTGPTS